MILLIATFITPLIASLALGGQLQAQPSGRSTSGRRSHVYKVQEKAFSLATQEGDRLFVKGFYGKLKLVGKSQSQKVSLRVIQRTSPESSKSSLPKSKSTGGTEEARFPPRLRPPTNLSSREREWTFSFQKLGRQIEFQVREPQGHSDWNFAKGPLQIPRFELVIEAPPMVAEIYWQKATVNVQNWKSDLMMGLGEGQVKTSRGKGAYKIRLHKGSLEVTSHQGDLDLDTYKGNIRIFNSSPTVNLENFAGTNHLEKVSGNIQLTSYIGSTQISHGQGEVEFKNIKSSIKIKDFEGSIRGKSSQGVVRISLVGQAKVHIDNGSGNVHLYAPKSGAEVNLGTMRGGIYAPSFLGRSTLAHMKIRQGRLKGQRPGNIYIRTQSGKIFLQ